MKNWKYIKHWVSSKHTYTHTPSTLYSVFIHSPIPHCLLSSRFACLLACFSFFVNIHFSFDSLDIVGCCVPISLTFEGRCVYIVSFHSRVLYMVASHGFSLPFATISTRFGSWSYCLLYLQHLVDSETQSWREENTFWKQKEFKKKNYYTH